MRELTPTEAALLLKLYRGRKFGGSHILEDNLLRGYPADRVKEFRQALDRLKRDGVVGRKSTAHGPAVFISRGLGKDVYEQLRLHYPWLPKPPWTVSNL